jgi:hypothetical protein
MASSSRTVPVLLPGITVRLVLPMFGFRTCDCITAWLGLQVDELFVSLSLERAETSVKMGILERQQRQEASWPITYVLISLLTPVLLFLSYVIYLRFLSPLSSIPGPFTASISRLWLLKHSWDGDMHRTMITLHAKHGKLVRTAPDEISVSDLTAIKKIYGAGTKFRKSDWYSVWQGHRKFDLFPERDEKIHGAQRRLVSGIYAMNSLAQYQGQVDEAIEVMVQQMKKKGGETVDLGVWLQLFAFGASHVRAENEVSLLITDRCCGWIDFLETVWIPRSRCR